MSDESPRELLARSKQYLEDAVDDGTVSEDEESVIQKFVNAYDDKAVTVPTPEDESARTPRTLQAYCDRLRTVARRLPVELQKATADDINIMWKEWSDGSHPDVKDDGVSANTLGNYQATVRQFYDYFDFGPDKENLTVVSPEKQNVSAQDILSEDEIHDIRDAATNIRNKALIDLLVYTGQRVRVIQSLRVGDIDLSKETGRFHLNTDEGGLKGADGIRPLLGAESSVRDWLQAHPAGDDDDAYLICHRAEYVTRKDVDHDAGEESLSQRTIRRALERMAERAGIEKDIHPHLFRHTAVTMWKRSYEMDDSRIKWMLGHKQHSRVMNTTYSHLQDEEYAEQVEVATGKRESTSKSPLTPATCPTCDEPLRDDAKACPSCGNVFTPDAVSAQERIQRDMTEGGIQAESDAEEEAIRKVQEKLENDPEARQAVIEALLDE